ncbi:cytochrome b/b6 domain-containing protein [Caulobacter sp. S45]|jgi:thiosulfate reductase cytochrome b subunit|uniref:cytochrome b/b6 domain-containing protein n=1 Tax=Caulobacter sp. S45 TaxID=1641861 RepID=UPI00131AC182|nr:cytochrome b/b6 domain-containing protein [Caulobacter sp. S45]
MARNGSSPNEVIYRHTFLVRLTHWVNALTIFVLIGTGLNIFNAHPQLYWGQAGNSADRPVVAIHAMNTAHGIRGVTTIGSVHFDTTGWLGWSRMHGQWIGRAWPSWITIPSFVDLADARHWHFFFAWVLAANGLVYLLWSLSIRHVQRDLWPTLGDLKSIPRSVLDHVKLKHPTGEAAKRYNVLQRLAYLGLILLVIGMVSTGLTLSPGFNAFAPWLLDLFGGRQSARTLHFAFAFSIIAFIVVHLVEVVLAGPINEVWSMISGRYRVPREHG